MFSKLQNTGDVTFRCSNSLDTNILFESIETTSNKVQQPQHIDKHHSNQETSNDNQPPSLSILINITPAKRLLMIINHQAEKRYPKRLLLWLFVREFAVTDEDEEDEEDDIV